MFPPSSRYALKAINPDGFLALRPPSPPGARRRRTETSTTSRPIRMTCPTPVEDRGRQGFDRSSKRRE